MKKIALIFCLVTTYGTVFTQSDCMNSFPQDSGEEIVMISHDKKDKIEGYSKSIVKEKSATSLEMSVSSYDKKGKLVTEVDYEITCSDGSYLIDVEAFIPAAQMESIESMKNMEVKITGESISIPQNMSVGQEMQNGEFSVKVSSSGMSIMSMDFEIVDRKIESKELIKTSLGEFECFKIVQYTVMKSNFLTLKTKTVEYWSLEEGSIRTESYNKKGEMIGYSERGSSSDLK